MRILLTALALSVICTTAAAAGAKHAKSTSYSLPVRLSAGLGLTSALDECSGCKSDHDVTTFLAGRAALPLGSQRTTLEGEIARDFNPDWRLSYRVGVWYTF